MSEPSPEPELMRRAAALAERAVREGTGGPFGAVVARGHEVVGEGWNRVLETNDPTAHAEVNAIRAASARFASPDLSGCELYASCEPCPMCLAAAHWARLDRVWFAGTRGDAQAAGFDDAVFHSEMERPPEERALVVLPFLREAALPAFAAWAAKPDRRLY